MVSIHDNIKYKRERSADALFHTRKMNETAKTRQPETDKLDIKGVIVVFRFLG